MARIIESNSNERRVIRLTTDDIIAVVQEYQQLTNGLKYLENIRDILSDNVIYLPESL